MIYRFHRFYERLLSPSQRVRPWERGGWRASLDQAQAGTGCPGRPCGESKARRKMAAESRRRNR